MKQKYGRPNEATPAKWNKEYTDYNAPLDTGIPAPVSKQIDTGEEASSKATEPAIVPPESEVTAGKSEQVVSQAIPAESSNPEGENKNKSNESTKKRKRHEGETPEERAERKRKKEEKREKRKSKLLDSGGDIG